MDVSREDYLRTLYMLYEINRDDIKSVDVANDLNVSKSSVSQMFRKLDDEGLISARPYSKIEFTKKGLTKAKDIMFRHRIIEVFLHKVLDYDVEDVHEEAHRLEHAFSKESIKRLDKFLGNPKKSPSGKVIAR